MRDPRGACDAARSGTARLLEALQAQTAARTVIVLDLGLRDVAMLSETRPVNAWQRRVLEDAADRLLAGSRQPAVALRDTLEFIAALKRDGYPKQPTGDALRDSGPTIAFGGLAFSLIGTVLGIGALNRWNRRRVRVCTTCKRPRRLLTEVEEDAHLSASQQAEERARSIDYDVWWCATCADVMVLSWAGLAVNVKHCPKCNAKTNTSTEQQVTAATATTTGLKRVEERCAHCSYTHAWDVTVPIIFGSDGSSGGGSDSSFGGGDSGGSGSSGSW